MQAAQVHERGCLSIRSAAHLRQLPFVLHGDRGGYSGERSEGTDGRRATDAWFELALNLQENKQQLIDLDAAIQTKTTQFVFTPNDAIQRLVWFKNNGVSKKINLHSRGIYVLFNEKGVSTYGGCVV